MRCQGRYETELSSTRAALDDAISQIALVRETRGCHALYHVLDVVDTKRLTIEFVSSTVGVSTLQLGVVKKLRLNERFD